MTCPAIPLHFHAYCLPKKHSFCRLYSCMRPTVLSGPLLRSLPAVLAGPVVDQELDSSAEYFPIITPYYDSLAQISASPCCTSHAQPSGMFELSICCAEHLCQECVIALSTCCCGDHFLSLQGFACPESHWQKITSGGLQDDRSSACVGCIRRMGMKPAPPQSSSRAWTL